MTIKKSQIGLEVFLCALGLGVAGEMLLFSSSWGLGAAVWAAAAAAAGCLLVNRWDTAACPLDRWLLAPLMVLALCYGWRDAPMLKYATTIGLASMFGLTMQTRQISLLQAKVAPSILATGASSLLGYPTFLQKDVAWNRLRMNVETDTLTSVIKGIILVAPCLLIFGLLLSSADEGFGELIGNLFSFNVVSWPARALFIGIMSVIAGVYLRAMVTKVTQEEVVEDDEKWRLYFGMLDAGIVLGLVNLMFLTFVFMQVGYLFGGASYINATAGVTLAEYARQGFFELIMVAGLALTIIMTMRRYFKPEGESHKTIFNALAGGQIALLMVMLVSAAQRMWLYTQAYGLTELRLYTSAFMVWLAFVLVWFVWTALKGKTLAFARGAVFAGLFVVFSLHVTNPEALIAETNINRAIEGKEELDHAYLARLSSDAVPTIVEKLSQLPYVQGQTMAALMANRWQHEPAKDWRSWNLSNYKARKAIKPVVDAVAINGQSIQLP